MNDSDSVKSILIVGGGTAGWMSAAYLSRFMAGSDCTITLLESPEVGTIGVGEATIPSLVKFVRTLQLDEDEFLRRCHATYKLGIQFIDWIEKDYAYWHPFGVVGAVVKGVDLFHYWLIARRAGHDAGPYTSYSLQAQLAEAGLAPRPLQGSSPIIERGAYAYHLDAGALAEYLQEIATAAGVRHVVDHVQHVPLDERGFIDRVTTAGGGELSADLYLDCTGFKALLIEQALGDQYVDWSRQLLCDRAVVTQLPRDDATQPFTRSTALDAGWVWRIPLDNRVGCGYVYSSSHVDEETAARELLDYAAGLAGAALEPRLLKMRVGRRNDFWVKNCVSVGLASGFIEPLESTGIFFIQRSLELLTEYLPDRSFHHALSETYNRRMSAIYDDVRDFIVLHYLLNRRDDKPFWRDSRSITVPDSLRARLELYDEIGIVEPVRSTPFRETSWYCILAGGRRLPRRSLPPIYFPEMQGILDLLAKVKKQNAMLAATLPSHQALMDQVHRSRT